MRRSTATWSVMLRAFDGPVPMLIMVMPADARLHQMKGRHLRHALRRRAGGNGIAEAGIARDHVARLDEGLVVRIAARHAFAADARKGFDIELVVGEDHEVLEVLRIGPRVVVEPVQRIVDPGGAEHGERMRRAGRPRQRAVDDRVVHGGEVGRIEQVAQRPVARGNARRNIDVASIGKVNRDRLVELADLDRHAVVLDQEPDLLGKIVAEEIGPRHRRLVHAGAGHEARRRGANRAGREFP